MTTREEARQIAKDAVSAWFSSRNISGGVQTAPLVAAIDAVYDALTQQEVTDASNRTCSPAEDS